MKSLKLSCINIFVSGDFCYMLLLLYILTFLKLISKLFIDLNQINS